MKMRRGALFALLTTCCASAALWWRYSVLPAGEVVFEPASKPPEAAPLCPWRNPEADLPRLFPGATRVELETRVLSSLRFELSQRLGRAPAPGENALLLHRIYRGDEPFGKVVTTRVKGTFGAIELVIAVDERAAIKGLLLQRMREPQTVSDALLACDWPRWLQSKKAESHWGWDDLMASLPPEANASARAIIEGIRTSVVLLAMSDQQRQLELAQSEHGAHGLAVRPIHRDNRDSALSEKVRYLTHPH